jgi:hypothetical protein
VRQAMKVRDLIGIHVPIERLEVGCNRDPFREDAASVAPGEHSSQTLASGLRCELEDSRSRHLGAGRARFLMSASV